MINSNFKQLRMMLLLSCLALLTFTAKGVIFLNDSGYDVTIVNITHHEWQTRALKKMLSPRSTALSPSDAKLSSPAAAATIIPPLESAVAAAATITSPSESAVAAATITSPSSASQTINIDEMDFNQNSISIPNNHFTEIDNKYLEEYYGFYLLNNTGTTPHTIRTNIPSHNIFPYVGQNDSLKDLFFGPNTGAVLIYEGKRHKHPRLELKFLNKAEYKEYLERKICLATHKAKCKAIEGEIEKAKKKTNCIIQ